MKMSNTTPTATKGGGVERVLAYLRAEAAAIGPGGRIPSVREVCGALDASPVTVQRAITQLSRQGSLVPRPGVGTFVAESRAATRPRDDAWQLGVLGAWEESPATRAFEIARPGHLELSSGYLDPTMQPVELVARAARRAAGNARLWGRMPVEGLLDLRHWFARDLGGGATEEDVLIVPGGQAALATSLRALCPYGGAVVVEAPTYFGALTVMRTLGLRVVPIPVDDEGIVTAGLEEAIRASGARVLYLQPAFSNPSGVVLSAERRREVLAIAQRTSAFVVEDDYARDLAYANLAPAPLFREGPGRVVYLRSLTKTTVPGLRIAAIVAHGPVLARLRAMRAAEDMFLAGVLQGTALEVVTSSGWEAHKKAVRSALVARREIVLGALQRHFPSAVVRRIPEGGFSLWVELPRGVSESELTAAASEKGVRVTEGAAWFPPGKYADHIRIALSGAGAEDLERGVIVLGKLGERMRNRRTRG